MNDWTEKLRREVANDVRVTGIVSRDAARGHNRIVVTGYEVLSLDDSHAADFGSEFDEYS